MIEKVEIGNATLYHGDSIEILPSLSSDAAIISDPPYGMAWDGKVTRGPNGTGKQGATRHYGETIADDDKPFDPSPWLGFDKVILWGFHHFANRLPKGSVLVWLKRYDEGFGSFLSDADLAWMKGGHGVYCKRDLSLQGESKDRTHPTQKPVPLMKWCIQKAGMPKLIVDPYMGSGTTGIAAHELGLQFIGVEKERKHFETACERIEQAQRQMCLYS